MVNTAYGPEFHRASSSEAGDEQLPPPPATPAPFPETSQAEPAATTTPIPGPSTEDLPATAPTPGLLEEGDDEEAVPNHMARHRRADNGDDEDDEEPLRSGPPLTPRHLRQSPKPPEDATSRLTPARAGLLVPVALAALFGLMIVAWAADNFIHSNQVQRNVEVAGHSVGGKTEESLQEAVTEIADEAAGRPVTVMLDGDQLDDDVSAGDLGLAVDQDAALDDAMAVGRSGSLVTRPFEWVGSFVNPRHVDLDYEVSETQAVGALRELYGHSIDTNEVVSATNPDVQLAEGEFVLSPGQSGRGLAEDRIPQDLQEASDAADGTTEPIVLPVLTTDIEPSIADNEAQQLADQLNQMTAEPLTLVANDEERELSTGELREWVSPVVDPTDPDTLASLGLSVDEDEDAVGTAGVTIDELDPLSYVFDADAAETAVQGLFDDLASEPVEAVPSLVGGQLEFSDSQDGVDCCGENVGQRVIDAMEAGETTVELDVEVVEPTVSSDDVESWGIEGPIGGSRGWRNGAEVPGPRPGYTTWQVGEGGRAHNIGLMAEQVNGSWIPPGDTWSINDHVGARQCPPYRDDAGAIVDNELVEECGGGTSQFATTMLNAAYFAGLDVTGQAHSQYFERYPEGREATMGAPGTGLDVTITNNTPYGVYIEAGRHGDELTVALWSAPHATVEDLGNTEGEEGECRTVTNTRQRTFPDGTTATDSFSARYRPGEGETC